jgi:hypothetical protein
MVRILRFLMPTGVRSRAGRAYSEKGSCVVRHTGWCPIGIGGSEFGRAAHLRHPRTYGSRASPTTSTIRLPMSTTNNTWYRANPTTVSSSTVKKSIPAIAPKCALMKVAQPGSAVPRPLVGAGACQAAPAAPRSQHAVTRSPAPAALPPTSRIHAARNCRGRGSNFSAIAVFAVRPIRPFYAP